jgi:hypothetical protein
LRSGGGRFSATVVSRVRTCPAEPHPASPSHTSYSCHTRATAPSGGRGLFTKQRPQTRSGKIRRALNARPDCTRTNLPHLWSQNLSASDCRTLVRLEGGGSVPRDLRREGTPLRASPPGTPMDRYARGVSWRGPFSDRLSAHRSRSCRTLTGEWEGAGHLWWPPANPARSRGDLPERPAARLPSPGRPRGRDGRRHERGDNNAGAVGRRCDEHGARARGE